MPRPVLSIAFVLCLTFTLLLGASAQEKKAPRQVLDEAKFFSAPSVASANKTIATIQQRHGKELLIETLKELPPGVKDMAAWVRSRAAKNQVDGVYIVITNKPKKFEIFADPRLHAAGLFDSSDVTAIIAILEKDLRGNRDDGLRRATDYTLERMDKQVKIKAELKDVFGVWFGPAVKAAVQGKKAAKTKGEIVTGALYLNFSILGKSPSIDIGYVVPIGQSPAVGPTSAPFEIREKGGKRQFFIAKYDADGPLTLTCETTGSKLKVTSSRKVNVPGVSTGPVDLTAEWIRPPAN